MFMEQNRAEMLFLQADMFSLTYWVPDCETDRDKVGLPHRGPRH